jgi:phage FluMu protein Com
VGIGPLLITGLRRGTRGANSDGTVDIRCWTCGAFICKAQYRGFSTAICQKCQGVDVPEPVKAEEPSLYNKEELSRFGGKIVETMRSAILRALGFKTARPEEVLTAPGAVVDETSSKAVAKSKRRRPLFGGGTKEKK